MNRIVFALFLFCTLVTADDTLTGKVINVGWNGFGNNSPPNAVRMCIYDSITWVADSSPPCASDQKYSYSEPFYSWHGGSGAGKELVDTGWFSTTVRSGFCGDLIPFIDTIRFCAKIAKPIFTIHPPLYHYHDGVGGLGLPNINQDFTIRLIGYAPSCSLFIDTAKSGSKDILLPESIKVNVHIIATNGSSLDTSEYILKNSNSPRLGYAFYIGNLYFPNLGQRYSDSIFISPEHSNFTFSPFRVVDYPNRIPDRLKFTATTNPLALLAPFLLKPIQCNTNTMTFDISGRCVNKKIGNGIFLSKTGDKVTKHINLPY